MPPRGPSSTTRTWPGAAGRKLRVDETQRAPTPAVKSPHRERWSSHPRLPQSAPAPLQGRSHTQGKQATAGRNQQTRPHTVMSGPQGEGEFRVERHTILAPKIGGAGKPSGRAMSIYDTNPLGCGIFLRSGQ